MNEIQFRGLDGKSVSPSEWLDTWAQLYTKNDDEEHDSLISKKGCFLGADFEQIGRWKDDALEGGKVRKWRPNVASVAYVIWMQAASELPKCPADSGVADFLRDWAGRRYKDVYRSGERDRSFGLSRATTLLYFLSVNRFPIFDSLVRNAMRRLLNVRCVPNTVETYLGEYCPLFSKLAELCSARDSRLVDKALVKYGKRSRSVVRRRNTVLP